jgi:hypothetical protein
MQLIFQAFGMAEFILNCFGISLFHSKEVDFTASM